MSKHAGTAGPARPWAASTALLFAAVLLVGLNLRGALAAVSPVLAELRADLGLSPSLAGLVTTVPVFCFAGAAPAAAWWGRRIGAARALLWALLLLAAATVLRVAGGAAVLLIGTVAIGLAMTVGNVLLPAVVKRGFGAGAGQVMGLYTVALAAGAATTAGLTAPVAAATSWRVGLSGWAVLALVAAVVWWLATRRRSETALPTVSGADVAGPGGTATPWRHPVAWAVALVLGLQTFLYYAMTTWLPTVLTEQLATGLGTGAAAATLFQLMGIPGALLVPLLIGRRAGQGWLGLAVAAGWVVLATGLLAWPAGWGLWVTLGGLAQGAGVSLAFTLMVVRAGTDAVARDLSGMSQLVGYGLGAGGPLLVGSLYGAAGGWTAPLLLMAAVGVAYGAFALVAGRAVVIGTESTQPDRGSPTDVGTCQ
ncbi:MFS transporter [Modestobacter lapidis]|nr:MFS transporter [Modestobacter lapidis]